MATSKTAARLRCAAVMLVALTCGGFALADSMRLTQASVKKFISSYPEVKSIAVTQAAAKGSKIAGAGNPLLAVVEAASDDTIKTEIDTTARRHGFRDGKEWFGVAKSVGQAYAHMKAGTGGGGGAKANQQLEKAISKIEDNDFLSEKQKKKLVNALREGASSVLEPPPAENMAVVKAMAPEIEAVVK